MKVLVTGGAGYIGSVLTRRLLERGDQVRVVDCGLFGLDHVDPGAELIVGNILAFDPEWLDGIGAVVHLAGLSNDPMAAFSPSLNYTLNAGGAAIVAHSVKAAKISRLVFGSTCSVYGFDESGPLNEEHHAKPPFPYAISKVMAERMLACLTDDEFRPLILRKGTVVGWSPRMRFDLVVNTMIKTGLVDGRIVIHNPDLWRPLIDVEDAAAAYMRALDTDPRISGIFNVAAHNYRLEEIAAAVQAGLAAHGVEVVVHTEHRADVRSYRVDTSKAASVLGFKADKALEQTVDEVVKRSTALTREELSDPRHYNIKQMERLMADGTIDHVIGPKVSLNRQEYAAAIPA